MPATSKSAHRDDDPYASTHAILDRIAEQQEQMGKRQQVFEKQLGEMGNKFGGYTESLMEPAIERILREEFGAEVIAWHVTARRGGENEEYDIVASANGRKHLVIVVEVKSRMTRRGFAEFERKLENFFKFMPEHRGKTLFGFVAAVETPKDFVKHIVKRGYYVLRPAADTFVLGVPPGFRPRAYKAT